MSPGGQIIKPNKHPWPVVQEAFWEVGRPRGSLSPGRRPLVKLGSKEAFALSLGLGSTSPTLPRWRFSSLQEGAGLSSAGRFTKNKRFSSLHEAE